MDKMLVVGFTSEIKAYEGSRALQELHNEGSINLYAKAVIVRDAAGKVAVKQESDMGPVGAAVGLLTGSLIGLIGGPVGVAAGATTGTIGGMLFDAMNYRLDIDFVNEAAGYLLPGKAAVVAEVWEEWTMPIDNRMETLGGVVFRRTREEIWDVAIIKDAEIFNAELNALEDEFKQSTGEAKAKLQKKIDATKVKLNATKEAIKAKIEASQKETDAKIKSLQERIAKVSGERKAKREARIAELKAEQKQRDELLRQAHALFIQAMY